MAYLPYFMKHLDEYYQDKLTVKTLEDWRSFKKKWYFDEGEWPSKTQEEKSKEHNTREAKEINGRIWGAVVYPDKIDKVAQYEFMKTETELGEPIVFPKGKHSPQESEYPERWSQECPHCEISAYYKAGEEYCPICGRKLLYSWGGD
ncbi:hypothetical protein [Leptospira inadai]|nr:hypothetical protein [Leptospira inadai]